MHTALLAIGLSVLMHVAWNLLARHVTARCNFLWWGLLIHLLVLGPWALWRLVLDSHWNSELLVAMLISAAANTLYFIALRQAYRFAPVALVYPLARSSPILIALWAWLLFGHTLSTMALVGITVSVAGLWLLAGSGSKGDSAHAIPWAMLAALCTSVYSLSDKVAVGHLPGFGAQLGFISVGYAASFVGLSLVQYRQHRHFVPPCRPALRYLLLGGVFIGTAYALVVRAMLELPAAYVVAYTNTGIVLATLLSVGLFRERQYWRRRLLATVVVGVGLLVLGLDIYA